MTTSDNGKVDASGPRGGKTNSDKLLALLMHFSDRSDARSVEHLADDLDLPHSTAYRYIRALSEMGLVVAVSAGSYILGPSIIMLDRQMRLSDPLLNSALGVKERLAKELPEPGAILVCRLFRNSVMCVDSAEIGKLEFEVSYARGRGLPLYRGAASKAILAHIPLRNVKSFFDAERSQFADAGLGDDWKAVKTALRRIRKDAVAITLGELDKGAIGIASPILSPDGQIMGSLGYVAPEKSTSATSVDAISEAIKAGAAEIERKLLDFMLPT